MKRLLLAAALAAGLVAPWEARAQGAGQPRASWLMPSAVMRRDVLACGTFASAAGEIRRVPLTTQARLPALRSDRIDVSTRAVTWTQRRDTAIGLNFTAISFHDGQGFRLRKPPGVKQATELLGAFISGASAACVPLSSIQRSA